MSKINLDDFLLTYMQQAEQLISWNRTQHLNLNANGHAFSKKHEDVIVKNDLSELEEMDPKLIENEVNTVQNLMRTDNSMITVSNADSNSKINDGYSNNMVLENLLTDRVNQPKRKYLKKGEGLTRFRVTKDYYKLKNKNKKKKNQINDNLAVTDMSTAFDNENKINRNQSKNEQNKNNILKYASPIKDNTENTTSQKFLSQKECDDLKLFEMLEEHANNSSFSSTSSLVRKLMEESIKSTPIKNCARVEKAVYEDSLSPLRSQNFAVIPNEISESQNPEENIETELFTKKKVLEIINEEPSRLETTVACSTPQLDDHQLIVNNDVIVRKDACSNESSRKSSLTDCCTCSECSCFEECSHLVSTSLSVYAAEEKSFFFSPAKKIQSPIKENVTSCTTADNNVTEKSSRDLENISNLTLIESNEDNAVLKMLLRTRLDELEREIEAFRMENSHLNKLRRDYEKEYNKFLAEKEEFLKKIREERQKEAENFLDEKKKFHREKTMFEKFVKETKNRPNKAERIEISKLKAEIATLKDEINQKTSRWGAAQARIRTQMKQLENHNATLKQEIEKLRKPSKTVTITNIKSKHKLENNDQETKRRSNDDNKNVKKSILRLDSKCSTSADQLNILADVESELNDWNNSDEHYHKQQWSNADSLSSDRLALFLDIINDAADLELYDKQNSSAACHDEVISLKEIIEKIHPDGSKEIWYPNGNVKKVSADGNFVKTVYYNGDVKEVSVSEKTVKYYYSLNKAWHTTYEDGFEIIEFNSGQIEKRYKDGTVEIIYPDGTFCVISSNGEERCTYEDGSIVIQDKANDEKVIILPNKEKEIHTKNYKKREYPDGTIKIVYADGLQETRYPNGRVRLKNKDGILISDNEIA